MMIAGGPRSLQPVAAIAVVLKSLPTLLLWTPSQLEEVRPEVAESMATGVGEDEAPARDSDYLTVRR